MRHRLILGIFLLLMASLSVTAATEISACKSSGWSTSTTYVLNTHLDVSGTCMDIDTDGVILDCNFSHLKGDGTGSGVYIDKADNVQIKNCIISDFDYGVNAIGDSSSSTEEDFKVYDSLITSNDYHGIYIRNTEGTVATSFWDNVISDNGQYGVRISNGQGTPNVMEWSRNYFIRNGLDGMYFSAADDWGIQDGVVLANGDDGIYLTSDSDMDEIDDTFSCDNYDDDFYCSSTSTVGTSADNDFETTAGSGCAGVTYTDC